MRLGTSGLGVIAVVSLLVTAAPERDDSGGNNEGGSIDRSRTNGSERTSRTRHSWPSQVATETSTSSRCISSSSSSTSSSFVKIEFESTGSTNPEASSHLPRPSLLPLPSLPPPRSRHSDRGSEIPTALAAGFTTDFPTSPRRDLVQPRNLENAAVVPPDVPSANIHPETKHEDNGTLGVDSNIPVSGSASRSFEEKFFVTLDSPLSRIFSDSTFVLSRRRSSRRRRRRRGKRETTTKTRRTEDGDKYDGKRSTRSPDETTKGRSNDSGATESAGTMNHPLTASTTTTTTTTKTMTKTTTTPNRRGLDENSRNATASYKVKMVRGTRESSRNKETTEPSNRQPHFRNGQDELGEGLKSSGRTMSEEANDDSRSEFRYLTNYSVTVAPTVRSESQNGAGFAELQNDGSEAPEKSSSVGRAIGKPDNHSPNEFILVGKTLRRVGTVVGDDGTVRDDAVSDRQQSRSKSAMTVLPRESEKVKYTSVGEEISRSRQMTSESSVESPNNERPLSRPFPSMRNTSGAGVTALVDNDKAARVRSFQTSGTEQVQQQQQQQQQHQRSSNLGLPLTPLRLPNEIAVKDTDDVPDTIIPAGLERFSVRGNQSTIFKTHVNVDKNLSKPSVNLVDGKPVKKYYEIKPSLITEMDRGTNLEPTTTPKRIFDTFVLPSVPSAFGKFGPYFLDEEDRRNVTERIGNTVQLDCRIGYLGHRKVTWLQHYKDSFRLLTVERESYSVDRRISLNFQYPDNWRLQIAYASIRDSGLYKCQVEIDQDRSLVKRYNVIITAPTLTITDDSGRPVSGERHLKAGSALKLRCEARDVMQRLNESVLWMRGDETLTEDVSENRTTEIVNEKEITVVVSTLLVERAIPRHAGNYSCVVPEKARTTIAVHVLNGELPAAVQHGSGVSTAVLNMWLIHLTASYGFFR